MLDRHFGNRSMNMYESKHNRDKRLFEKRSSKFGVKEGHTIFCEDDCGFTHHEMLLSLVLSKRNDPKTFDKFKDHVRKELAAGWNRNSDIPDKAKYFRFPLVHWAAVYGKLSALQWLLDQDFDVEVTNTQGETALHRLIACQAHERAVDPRIGRGRRYSLGNIIQVFSKVLNIFTGKCPQLILRYDYVERNTPLALCLKLLLENIGTCPRLVQYHQALFKVLCERLVNLIKQGKLSEEFIRNGFSLKNSSGNTIWHVAASCPSETVTSSLNMVMNAVESLDLSISNSNYETPILVALKNSNQEFAALIEAYKFSNCPVPIVKMEMLSDSEKDECCCEHRNNKTEQDSSSVLQDVVDRCNGSCVNSSYNGTPVGQNASLVRDDQSFTEPRNATVDQEKVVFTRPHENDHRDDTGEICSSRMEVDSTSQCSGELGSLGTSQGSGNFDLDLLDGSCGQEQIVIEKQIDLCLSVSQSTDSSDLTTVDENTSHDSQKEPDELQKTESSPIENNNLGSNILAEALRLSDVSDNDGFLEGFDPATMSQNIEFPTPPDSSTSPELPEQNINEPHTPPPKESTACRSISVTPVLLIKLLSEPDVSEKFESLLKDVITGDTAKVDSTQSTLQELKASKLKLDCEINSSEDVLVAIGTKKEKLNEEIKRLQQEICDLQSSEEKTKTKLSQLKEQQAKFTGQIEECESTYNRLKRRLSDCTGALFGLSPKSQKRC
jgi:hypothetical protein